MYVVFLSDVSALMPGIHATFLDKINSSAFRLGICVYVQFPIARAKSDAGAILRLIKQTIDIGRADCCGRFLALLLLLLLLLLLMSQSQRIRKRRRATAATGSAASTSATAIIAMRATITVRNRTRSGRCRGFPQRVRIGERGRRVVFVHEQIALQLRHRHATRERRHASREFGRVAVCGELPSARRVTVVGRLGVSVRISVRPERRVGRIRTQRGLLSPLFGARQLLLPVRLARGKELFKEAAQLRPKTDESRIQTG
jgi:hypothetical protein